MHDDDSVSCLANLVVTEARVWTQDPQQPWAEALGVRGGRIIAIGTEYAKRIHAAGSLYDYLTDRLGSRRGAAAGWLYYSGIIVLGGSILVLIAGYIHDTLAAE